jgi:hypothetical protein
MVRRGVQSQIALLHAQGSSFDFCIWTLLINDAWHASHT